MVDVIVDDEGPGIPQSERRAVFRAFHRAEVLAQPFDRRDRLGLAIAVGIVERQHHGSIEIADAPGGGARIIMSVPSGVSA